MLTKKKKLSKKEIKEDKLISLYYKVYGYFEENRSQLITYSVVLAVVIAVGVFFVSHRIQNNQKAGSELSKIMNVYDSGSYLEAIEGKKGAEVGLKSIVENYGSTENGEIAKIYLANSYNRLGKYDEAFKYYKDYDGSIKIYEATALAGQAGYYADKKDFVKAADLYLKASRVSDENVLNPEYLYHAGVNFLNANNNEKAKEAFAKIKKDYQTSPEARKVNPYLALLD